MNAVEVWAVRSTTIATFVLGGLLACGSGTADDNIDPNSSDAGAPPSEPNPRLGGNDDAGDSPGDAGADADGRDAAPERDDGTRACVAGANASKSLSKVTSNLVGGTITITSLTTIVTNSFQRDGNSLKVSVQPGGAGAYTFVFGTGAILANGATVPVPLPPNFKIQPGDTLKLETTFDEGNNFDPTVPCFMHF